MGLLFDAIDAERHGGQLVADDCLLLVCRTGDGALFRRDEFWTLDAVLVVHTAVAQGDGLCCGGTCQVLQVQRDGLYGLRRVGYLDDDLVGVLVEGC